MKVSLFDFQEDALEELKTKLSIARSYASISNPQAVSFSAPTGAGKTIIMTSLFENIFYGGETNFETQENAVILWISDMPELNEQTKLKIESKSSKIKISQLLNIENTFDAETFKGGNIYFINTQKLGSDKLLTKKSDSRAYTIWETFNNTAKNHADRFYVVIDEAHRGMTSGKEADKAKSVIQKFILGSTEDGLANMPLLIGISATPKRFEDLLSGTSHSVHKIHIMPEEVQKSGLIKDRILIEIPEAVGSPEMTLLSEAAKRWQIGVKEWDQYCDFQDEPRIAPILVVQVNDGNNVSQSTTDLNTALETIEQAIERPLGPREVVHTFGDSSELNLKNRSIKHVEASRIQDDKDIGVVIFKMSLSTGWDCPRAEVMMSFRTAQDHTYIAQLLGRMVRNPLARRIESDSSLNDVYLFLPNFDSTTVNTLINELKNDEYVPPTETGTSRELVTLERADNSDHIFTSLSKLSTYRVDSVRKQSSQRRVIGLARALTNDGIDSNALDQLKNEIITEIDNQVLKINSNDELASLVGQIMGIELKTFTFENGELVTDQNSQHSTTAVSADIDKHFRSSGRLLGNGMHIEYWKAHMDRPADEVRAELIAITANNEAMTSLEAFCEDRFDDLYTSFKLKIAHLKDSQRVKYDRLRLSSSKTKDIPWVLPDKISVTRSIKAASYDKHLYVEKSGVYKTDLGTWERELLEEEMSDSTVVGWVRNEVKKPWSFEIPYEVAGEIRPMYPDMIIIRNGPSGHLVDILEPHDPSKNDNSAKAKGLAKFAESQWSQFNRIQLIRKKKGPDGKDRYYRLDMGKEKVRKKVLTVESDQHLNSIFEDLAETKV